MNSNQTLGEKGITGRLFACPLCRRTGYSGPGLRNHRCPTLPCHPMASLDGTRRMYHDRLPDDLLLAVLEAGE